MAPGLFGGAARRIDEEQCCVCGAGAGDHVAGVLEVAGCVGDDELAPLGREVAVGHIDGDLLLALGEESVCEEREVEVWRAVRPEYGGVGELVFEEGAGVEEEPAQEGGLAVVHRAGDDEAEQVLGEMACDAVGGGH